MNQKNSSGFSTCRFPQCGYGSRASQTVGQPFLPVEGQAEEGLGCWTSHTCLSTGTLGALCCVACLTRMALSGSTVELLQAPSDVQCCMWRFLLVSETIKIAWLQTLHYLLSSGLCLLCNLSLSKSGLENYWNRCSGSSLPKKTAQRPQSWEQEGLGLKGLAAHFGVCSSISWEWCTEGSWRLVLWGLQVWLVFDGGWSLRCSRSL